MMTHLSQDTLARYRDGKSEHETLHETERHLSECADCRALLRAEVAFAAPRLAHRLLPDGAEPVCPDDDRVTRYVAGKADAVDRETMDAHLAFCAECREEIAALRQFQDTLQGIDWKILRAANRRERGRDTLANFRRLLREGLRAGLTRWNRASLSRRILYAMALGLVTGLAFGARTQRLNFVSTGIVHLLGAVATPLIFLAVLHALMRTQIRWSAFGRLFGLLLTNTFAAVGIGLAVINLLHPGTMAVLSNAPDVPETLPPVPHSLLAPLVENNVLLVLLLAVGLGIALREVRQEDVQAERFAYRALEDCIETAYRCLMRVMQWIISLIPLAVFAASANLTGAYGNRPFESLGGFVLTVLLALPLQVIYYMIRLRFGSRIRPLQLLHETRSALLTAFTTASSAATIPLTYSRVKDRLGLSEEATSMGVLVGGNINRDGTALFQVMGVLFIAQALGLHLGWEAQAIAVSMAVLASVCAPGIPEAGLVTMVLIFQALHLPQAAAYLLFLMPIDWLLDRCRTTVNVLGHITTACLLEGKSPAHGAKSGEVSV